MNLNLIWGYVKNIGNNDPLWRHRKACYRDPDALMKWIDKNCKNAITAAECRKLTAHIKGNIMDIINED